MPVRLPLAKVTMTPEWRKKISDNNVGNLGRKFSKEHCQRISLARKGIKPSLRNRRRSSEANKDRVFSLKHRQRISEAKKTRPSERELSSRFQKGHR